MCGKWGAGTGCYIPSAQFCCEPKTIVKNNLFFKKRGERQAVPLWLSLCSPFEGSCQACVFLPVSTGQRTRGLSDCPRWPACTPEVPRSVPAVPSAPHGWMDDHLQISGQRCSPAQLSQRSFWTPTSQGQGLCVLFGH